MRSTCSFYLGLFPLTESAAPYLQLKAYQFFFFVNGTAFVRKAYLFHLFGNVSVLQTVIQFYNFFVQKKIFFELEFLCVDQAGLKLYFYLPCVNS